MATKSVDPLLKTAGATWEHNVFNVKYIRSVSELITVVGYQSERDAYAIQAPSRSSRASARSWDVSA